MARAQTIFRTPGGSLTAGTLPRVVGVLSSFPDDFSPASYRGCCDLIEIRLDETGPRPGWLDRCREIEAEGIPVLLTVRSSSEGGKWSGTDEERLAIFEESVPHVSAVDVELRSPIAPAVARAAGRLGKVCVVSYHDFQATPPLETLAGVVEEAAAIASIVKVSIMAARDRDVQTLETLLKRGCSVPLCVIGMGPLGAQTRVLFPLLGSCLTYGYLDKPSAPGQFGASELVARLRSLDPGYDRDCLSRAEAPLPPNPAPARNS